MDFIIAWRNIWRNPRRTAVILMAVVIGVWSMVFLGALMRGVADGMIKNGIATLTGHIQIHQKDYPDDPVVDHRIDDATHLIQTMAPALPQDSRWALRIRVNAVANNARHSTGVQLVGIDPVAEKAISFIGSSVTIGDYLAPDDRNGVLIGQALAEQFETVMGRKLILMAQDSHGEIASRAFRIRGIFQAEMEATEKSFLFVTLRAAQDMLQVQDAISEVAILLPNHDMASSAAAHLRDTVADPNLQIRSWRQILPLITAALELYDPILLIWFVVVFVAMGFGIVNTTLMAVFERMREFGLLKALGMRPWRIIRGILIESLLILSCGMVLGNLLGILTCWALSINGIDLSALAEGVEYAGMARIIYPKFLLKDIINADLVVLLLGLLVSLYPAVKAARFLPVEALAHN